MLYDLWPSYQFEEDTLTPNVRLADYPDNCVKSGNVLRCECNAVGGNSLGFSRDNFQIADLCDPAPLQSLICQTTRSIQ